MTKITIAKKWSSYRKKDVKKIADVYGAYELADGEKDIIYIGEGKLRDRLLAHFVDGYNPIPGVSYYRYEKTGSKKRGVQRQNALLAEYKREYGHFPWFNQRGEA